MNERDEIFRDRLISAMRELNDNGRQDEKLRRMLGNIALKLFRQGNARNWADLKERADGATYDSMLRLFQRESQAATKKGDTTTVTAFELLALSLIARRQYQSDLDPGVAYLDNFIEEVARIEQTGGVRLHIPAKGAR